MKYRLSVFEKSSSAPGPMKRLLLTLLFLLPGDLPPLGRLRAAETLATLEQSCQCCALRALPQGPESASYKKYAPDRTVDLLHLQLRVTPHFDDKSIGGTAILRFKTLHRPVSELRLDAVRLAVEGVESASKPVEHRVTDEEIHVFFNPPLPPHTESELTIRYSAQPSKGLYFRTEAMGYSHSHLWTQGETIESRHWFPSLDHPVEKFTSEILCSVPQGMVALSNGRQLAATPGQNGQTTFHWLQDKPHVNYLITLVVGPFEKIEQLHGQIPLEFWTLPSDRSEAPNSFRYTHEMMRFFEAETGIAYPWAKYGQVTVQDYHWGGMENTSLTTLNDRTLFQADTENLYSSDSLVAHELAHQWFGDLVTCKDWSHIWLNEGFATYYDWLWQGHHFGWSETQLALHRAAKSILSHAGETRGIVWRKFQDPGEMFNYLAYPKGAWVLHMLRARVGVELYQKAIHTYLEKHAYGSVTSEDLRSVFEELTGQNLDRFFEQWLYGVGAPHLDVSFDWDQKTKLARIAVKQTQKISEDAPLFHFPLPVRFEVQGKAQMHSFSVTNKEAEFFVPLDAAPSKVRIDPEVTVLAKISFKPPRPMLEAQIADSTDFLGQIHALEILGEKPDKTALSLIASTLAGAHHHAVRSQAAETLRKIHSEEALDTLLKTGPSQADARVRHAVAEALGGFFSPKARAGLLKIVREEKNPAIRASAIRGLSVYADPEVEKLLGEFLRTPSFRNRIAEAVLAAMKGIQNPKFTEAILKFLEEQASPLQTTTHASALETLAELGRHHTDKTRIREHLAAQLNHPKEKIRLTALAALGTLGDIRALAVLENFSRLDAEKPEKAAAEKAVEKLRSEKNTGPEVASIRKELLEMQKLNTELRKQVETLEKKMDALNSKGGKQP
jgi:aminopeptidase N